MSINRYDLVWHSYTDASLDESDDGDWVSYEDHLVEVSRLLHIISALENELKIQAEQIAKLQKQLFTADNLIFELSQE